MRSSMWQLWLKGTIVLHNIKDVPSSFAMLTGIIYWVNLEYPEIMRYSFEFLQRVVMKIKPDQASARVHSVYYFKCYMDRLIFI
uniref:Uncharacterized protein n=1 Tax=Mola mola TaxID=94237 RepID=A0A3Q3W5N4_MOLML